MEMAPYNEEAYLRALNILLEALHYWRRCGENTELSANQRERAALNVRALEQELKETLQALLDHGVIVEEKN